ncbi:hypothetical protein TNCV_3043501 [Trichonephila clavipes]|nr:hypothetical protein TNCV_3043501 [Trichonephila clavipes]
MTKPLAFKAAQRIQNAQEKTSSWRDSTHHGVQQGRHSAGHLVNTRHGAYLEYIQNIVLQPQGEDPTGKPNTPYLQY